MTADPIPIANIYYLYCYAWDRFEAARDVSVGALESPDLPNLLARVLANTVGRLMRRGLDRGYQTHVEDVAALRGKVDVVASMGAIGRRSARITCEFDELTSDVPTNRLLKAGMRALVRVKSLDRSLAGDLTRLIARMPEVGDVQAKLADFSRLQLHRNNGYYHLALKVAELTIAHLLPDEQGQGSGFWDIQSDDQKLAALFEAFVRNFYRVEQTEFQVRPLQMEWNATSISTQPTDRLPLMRTDVFLRGKQRSIIIDTKFYREALHVHHGASSFRSGNLYQLFTYLKHAQALMPDIATLDGMLLYPAVNRSFDATYSIMGHRVRVATVDLAQPWPEISTALLNLLSY